MLHLYIMQKRQEFTHSTFASRDAFRRAVDDCGLEASYLHVLVPVSAGQRWEQRERSKSFLVSRAKLLPSCSLQQYWMDVQ